MAGPTPSQVPQAQSKPYIWVDTVTGAVTQGETAQ